MHSRLFCLFVALTIGSSIYGQHESIKISIDKDTIRMGDVLEYKVSLENINGSVDLPPFDGFSVVGGPNSSSSFSMVNGKVSQSKSYTVYLSPRKAGLLTIDAPKVKENAGKIQSKPVQVFVISENGEDVSSQIPSSGRESDSARSTGQQRRTLKKI